MASTLYPKGREAFLNGDIDWLNDDIKVVLVDSTYVYNAAHDFLDDVTGIIDTSGNLGSKTSTDGVADAANVTFASVAAGDTIDGVIIFKDTGSAATSRLIAYYDRDASGVEFAVATDGSNVVLNWSDGATKIFRL